MLCASFAFEAAAQVQHANGSGNMVVNGTVAGDVAAYYRTDAGNHLKGGFLSVSPGGSVHSAYGAYTGDTGTRNVFLNRVELYGKAHNVYGGSTGSGEAKINSVTLYTNSDVLRATGGASGTGTAANNTVTTKSGSKVGLSLRGGYVDSGTGAVTSNEVIIEGGTFGATNFSVEGGYQHGKGDAINNHVIIYSTAVDTVIDNRVIGGRVEEGGARDNTVTIKGGQVKGNIYGALNWVSSKALHNNTVTIDSSRFNGTGTVVHGALQNNNSSGDATNNKVYIKNGTVAEVHGGGAYSGAVTGNEVTITGGHIAGRRDAGKDRIQIYGGYATAINSTKSVENNTVTIAGGSFNASVDEVKIIGGTHQYGSGKASNNTVDIKQTATQAMDIVYGGHTDSDAERNKVIMRGGTLKSGGYLTGGRSDENAATHNTVTIGGTAVINGVVQGGSVGSGSKSANYNTVTIEGGTLNDTATIYGGRSWGGTGDASHNKVIIKGGSGTYKNHVYGGVSYDGDATHNTIDISGNPNFSDVAQNTILYGGWASNSNSSDVTTGNTLNLRTTNVQVKNIANFENLNFYVQPTTPKDSVFLHLTDNANTDIKGTKIGVAIDGSSTVLQKNDKVILIHKDNGVLLTDSSIPNTITGMVGISTLYDFDIAKQGSNRLIATLSKAPTNSGGGNTGGGNTGGGNTGGGNTGGGNTGGGNTGGGNAGNRRANPQTKSLSAGRLAASSLLNSSANFASNAGMGSLTQATQNAGAQGFGAIGGGQSRTKTGSHIDVKGVHLIAGVGAGFTNGAGKLTAGAFFEVGRGSYDNFNDFANMPTVKSKGNTNYYGVGVMIKQEFNNQWFIEGGARVGRSEMDYHSDDFGPNANTTVRFSGKSNYAGLNFGVGRTFAIGQKNSITPYAKVLWTHSGKQRQVIAGETFTFNSVDSVRTHLGARLQHKISDKSQIYADVAWEREHQGAAKGTARNATGVTTLPEPSLKGNTGIVGAGVTLKPTERLTIEMGVNGEFGKRRGVAATGKIKYSF